MPRQTALHLDSTEAFGRRLHESRTRAGLRLQDLAFPGCSIGYLSHLERANRTPSLQVVHELARRLGVSAQWLAKGVDEEQDSDPLAEAEVALRFGDLETAATLYTAALATARDASAQARILTGLGRLALRRDDAKAALADVQAALQLDPTLAADDMVADIIGQAYWSLGQIEAAADVFRARLEGARQSAATADVVCLAVRLADILIDLEASDEAFQVLIDALDTNPQDDPLLLARGYWAKSRRHAEHQESAAAARYARAALGLLDAAALFQRRAHAHYLLAVVELDRGNHDRALGHIDTGRALARSGGSTAVAGFDLLQARALAGLGEFEQASVLVNRAVAEADHHDPVEIGRCYAELANVCVLSDATERALELYELALEYLTQAPNRWLAPTYGRLADVLEATGDRDGALLAYKRAAAAEAPGSR